MIRDNAIERYGFRCGHCGASWTRDYEVSHVTNAGGDTWDSYSFNGSPAMTPTAPGAVSCPRCGANMQVRLIASRPTAPGAAPTSGTGRREPAEAAHALVDEIETLIAAARAPGGPGFTRLRDLEAVMSGIEDGLGRLPLLLHELGLDLDRAANELSVHGHGVDAVPAAVRALYRAANTSSEFTEQLVDRLDHARTLVAGLEGGLVRTRS
ncbi:MAG: hypothetical protein GEV09_01140 [Pseudonocardiaceae bacterium]|nr:hypothetical protein [Pseudonocardiaceae bacterium]